MLFYLAAKRKMPVASVNINFFTYLCHETNSYRHLCKKEKHTQYLAVQNDYK